MPPRILLTIVVCFGCASAAKPGTLYRKGIDAFEAEPGDTHYSIQNAFTRLASHGNLPERARYAVMESSGDWMANFQLVTATLPRPIAQLVGAQIIDAPDRRLQPEQGF